MNRTFHQHVSVQGIVAVVLLAVAALWCFLARDGILPICGFACLMAGAAAVDRLVNTTYVFTPDDHLVITRGRLGKSLTIDVDTIVSVRSIRGTLFFSRHLVIEYGNGRITYAQPAKTNDFVGEIHRRHKHISNV